MLKRKSYDNRNDGAVGRRAEIRPWSRLKRKTYDNRDIAFPQMYKVPAFFSDSPLVTDTGSISDLAKETTWSTWSAVINLTSRAGELRSAPSGPDDRDRVTG